jgi:hypothetical protein
MANNGHDNKNKNRAYEELNKLPLIMWEYRSAMMKTLKMKFMEQLEAARKEETTYCKDHNVTPMMVAGTYNNVCDLLSQCTTIFEIEALARFVFDDNEIPDRGQLKKRAGLIELSFPFKMRQ